MTIDEAKEYIRSRICNEKGIQRFCRDNCMYGEDQCAFHVAIEALEKQIPKKPSYEGDGYYNGELVYDTWICPCCEKHYEVDYEDYDYCPNCGQHIDHSGLTEDD